MFCILGGNGDNERRKIVANTENTITILPEEPWVAEPDGSVIESQVHLQRPYVGIEKCRGCGVCEHECPVRGKRAMRVSAESQMRDSKKSLLLKK